jgi:hypothetical protein
VSSSVLRTSKPSTQYGILQRPEFIEEFDYRYLPGQHVVAIGPTGRGKTTLFSQMLPSAKTSGTIISTLGYDKVLAGFGKRYTADHWPPRFLKIRMYDEIPYIRRYEGEPRSPMDFACIRNVNRQMLYWMFARSDWTIYFPDLQVVTDPRMMGLGKEVEQLLLTLRKRGSSVWMDAQAPRWIPRAASDQTSHLLIWKTRDEGIWPRLREIAGLDINLLKELFNQMEYHDAIWVDVIHDDYYIVLAK